MMTSLCSQLAPSSLPRSSIQVRGPADKASCKNLSVIKLKPWSASIQPINTSTWGVVRNCPQPRLLISSQDTTRRAILKPSMATPIAASISTDPNQKQDQGSVDEDLIRRATAAVRLACRLTEAVQRSLKTDDSAAKADESPVTVADYGAQAIVTWALKQTQEEGSFRMVAEEDTSDFSSPAGKSMLSRITALINETLRSHPPHSLSSSSPVPSTLVSEQEVVELIDCGAAAGGPEGQFWVLDPIDGTRGFLRGQQYAVALALLQNGRVVFGALGCPNLPWASIANGIETAVATGEGVGCLFFASRGGGAFVEPLHGEGGEGRVKLAASSLSDPSAATFCESFESRHSKHHLTADIAQRLQVTLPPVRIDSQAKYGAMARGDAAIYMRFPPDGYREKIWDHAAGSIVMEEAGGVVCDASGKPLDFSKGRFLDLDTGIIATNRALLPRVLEDVRGALARL